MVKLFVLLSAFVAAVAAQSSASQTASAGSTQSQAMPPAATQSFDASQINSTMKLQWCTGQLNTCPQICGGLVSQNTCNEDPLSYICVCANGTVPDCTRYQSTLPFYECEATFAQCLQNHPSTDPEGQAQCEANHQCANLTAAAVSSVVTTSVAPTSSATGSATGSAASTSSSHAAAGTVSPVPTGAFVALLMALCRLVL